MALQNDGINDSEILYGVIARGSCILASHCAKVGNFNDVAKDLLIKIDQQVRSNKSPAPSKMTYKDGNYLYHYSRSGDKGVIFLCMTDDKFPRQEAFKFMDTLAKRLKEQFPYQLESCPKTIPFSMNSEFEPVIGAEIKKANRDAMHYSQATVSFCVVCKKSEMLDLIFVLKGIDVRRSIVLWEITFLYTFRVIVRQKARTVTMMMILHS